mmetsp:Transcript_24683/g.43507  ORF Transcript_24683/g.43507 Transcript_24683/m.43507 type:complete len:173 (-) Transcript_24683:38-556(-)
MDIDFKALQHLLKASSKAEVKTLVRTAHRASVGLIFVQNLATDLELTEGEMNDLLAALKALTISYMRGLAVDWPVDFMDQLKGLLLELLAELRDTIKSEADLPTLPKFIGADWRVDVRVASSAVNKVARVPRATLQLRLEDGRHTFELSKEQLGTLLDGMMQIKEHLEEMTS